MGFRSARHVRQVSRRCARQPNHMQVATYRYETFFAIRHAQAQHGYVGATIPPRAAG